MLSRVHLLSCIIVPFSLLDVLGGSSTILRFASKIGKRDARNKTKYSYTRIQREREREHIKEMKNIEMKGKEDGVHKNILLRVLIKSTPRIRHLRSSPIEKCETSVSMRKWKRFGDPKFCKSNVHNA